MDLEDEMDSLECEICFHQFNEGRNRPHTIFCGHTICSECALKGITDSYITCPFCREEYNVESVNDLPVNFSLLKVMRTLKTNRRNSLGMSSNQDTPAGLSSHVAVEPQSHAGICHNHGSYKLFWCHTCKIWVCRDCTVLEHPTSSCSIMSVNKALKVLKIEEDNSIDKTQYKIRHHLYKLNDHMSDIHQWDQQLTTLVKDTEKFLDGLRKRLGELKEEFSKKEARFLDGHMMCKNMTEVNIDLQKAETIDDIMLLRRESERQQKSIQDWIESSPKEMEPFDIINMSKKIHDIVKWAQKLIDINPSKKLHLQNEKAGNSQAESTAAGLSIEMLSQLCSPISNMIWAVLDKEKLASRVTCDNRGVRLHSLCTGLPPDDNCIIIPYLDVRKLTKELLGFITLEIGIEQQYGTVVFTIDHNCPGAEAFIRRLTGEGNDPLINSYFYGDVRLDSCVGLSGGSLGKLGVADYSQVPCCTILNHLRPHKNQVAPLEECHSLDGWLTIEENRNRTFFTIWYQDRVYQQRTNAHQKLPVKLGRVIEGMQVVKSVIESDTERRRKRHRYGNTEFTKPKIIDCGLYLCHSIRTHSKHKRMGL